MGFEALRAVDFTQVIESAIRRSRASRAVRGFIVRNPVQVRGLNFGAFLGQKCGQGCAAHLCSETSFRYSEPSR